MYHIGFGPLQFFYMHTVYTISFSQRTVDSNY